MAFPSVEGTATTNGTAAATSHAVTLPATVSTGSTLIVVARAAVAGAIDWPAGWTEVFENSADASDDTTAWAWKLADGTEDGTTISVTHGNGKAAFIAYSITGAEDPTIQAPESGTPATGTSTIPDPSATTPTGGAKDYLWIWAGGWEGEQTSPPVGNPTNYSSPLGANSGTASAVATNCRVATATRTNNAASEDPGTWTISVSDDWTAWTIAVHPAPPPPAVGAFTNRAKQVGNYVMLLSQATPSSNVSPTDHSPMLSRVVQFLPLSQIINQALDLAVSLTASLTTIVTQALTAWVNKAKTAYLMAMKSSDSVSVPAPNASRKIQFLPFPQIIHFFLDVTSTFTVALATQITQLVMVFVNRARQAYQQALVSGSFSMTKDSPYQRSRIAPYVIQMIFQTLDIVATFTVSLATQVFQIIAAWINKARQAYLQASIGASVSRTKDSPYQRSRVISRLPQAIQQALSITVIYTVALVKQVQTSLMLGVSLVVVLVKGIGKILVLGSVFSVSMVKQIPRALAVAGSWVASIVAVLGAGLPVRGPTRKTRIGTGANAPESTGSGKNTLEEE
ncbi:MAG: hypothetical protein ACRDIC_05970 [bacterium]